MTDQPTPETDAIFTDNVPEDAQIVAFCERLERERDAARAERDEHIARNNDSLLALHLTTTERDEARADAARLRDALEGMLIAEIQVRQMDGWAADEVETEPHWMAARAALAQLAK
jgi:hypothetical protein